MPRIQSRLVQKHGCVEQIQQTKTKTNDICERAAASEVAQIQMRIQKILFGGIAKFGGGVTTFVNCTFISEKLRIQQRVPSVSGEYRCWASVASSRIDVSTSICIARNLIL